VTDFEYIEPEEEEFEGEVEEGELEREGIGITPPEAPAPEAPEKPEPKEGEPEEGERREQEDKRREEEDERREEEDKRRKEEERREEEDKRRKEEDERREEEDKRREEEDERREQEDEEREEEEREDEEEEKDEWITPLTPQVLGDIFSYKPTDYEMLSGYLRLYETPTMLAGHSITSMAEQHGGIIPSNMSELDTATAKNILLFMATHPDYVLDKKINYPRYCFDILSKMGAFTYATIQFQAHLMQGWWYTVTDAPRNLLWLVEEKTSTPQEITVTEFTYSLPNKKVELAGKEGENPVTHIKQWLTLWYLASDYKRVIHGKEIPVTQGDFNDKLNQIFAEYIKLIELSNPKKT